MDSSNATTASPASATNSSAPAPSGDSSSSPPTPSSTTPPPSSPPPSSPPPPDSSPPPNPSPPPATPPPKSEAPKSEAPPPEQKSSPPPPTKDSSPSPPPPAKSPATDKPSASSPPPPTASSPPPPAAGNPPAPPTAEVFSSPPPPGKSSAAVSPPPPAAGRSTRPSGSAASSGGNSATVSSPSPSSSISTGVIVAVAAGIGVLILVAVVICIACAARKKKRKENYMETPPTGGPRGDYYNNGSNWNTPHSLPRQPGQMGTPPGWAPPPGNNSSDYSSGFSGPYPNNNVPRQTPSPNMAFNSNQSSFSYEDLARATNGFADENVIGQGGFGYVHKGVLPCGKEVAVKSLKAGSGQGEREFQAEVEIISRVHHRHLVSLVGYCIADERRMLVYQFVPNKTLEFHLHGKGQPTMEWGTRMRIAMGSAKGLAYLHEDCHPRIIHRDIKAANILLDYKFEAMVADFGLAKLTSDNFTHVSTRVMGTFGYLAPEYASSGKLTDKSDVFSYGVMLLELITGRRPIDTTNQIMEDSLVEWSRPIAARVLEDKNYEELVDPRLGNNFDPNEMDRMIACAAASTRHSARRRPKMIQIVRTLEGDQSSLNDTSTKSTPESSVYDTKAYNADMLKFKKMINSSNDFGSSEFEHTSEYGLNPSSSSSDLASQEFANSGPHKQQRL